MTRVIKLDGAPGVGKTTKLFDYVSEEAEAGASLGEIYYLTFARSGRQESKERLADVFPDEDLDDVRKRAKTFHGATWVACAVNDVWEEPWQQVIQRGSDSDIYQDFCDRHGLSFSDESKNELEAARDGQDIEGNGNRLFAINDWLKLNRMEPAKHARAPVSLGLSHERTVNLLEAWDEFKRESREFRLFEHADYVDEAIQYELVPPANILFIDEFQDLSPQEYLLYKQWRDSGELDTIYIAGDANQSIYSFRAGTPLYFEETDVDEVEQRKTSYRCPERIASVARWVLDSCPSTDPQGFQSHQSGGTAEYAVADDDTALASLVRETVRNHEPEDGNAVFLLTRANYQASSIASALRDGNIPFEWLGSRSGAWQDPMPDLLGALRGLQNGEPILTRQVKALFKHSPGDREDAMMDGETLLWGRIDLDSEAFRAEEVWRAYPDIDRVEELARKLDLYSYQQEALAGAVSADTEITPDRVKIGTIHSAKGLEAPAVLLFDGYTSRLEDLYYSGDVTAEEHRLFYVGATRGSETLRVVGGYFDGPSFPPFKNGLPDFSDGSGGMTA